jgi:hypothetical protein
VSGTRRHVLFFPRDVPAVGYRIYEIRKSQEVLPKEAESFSVKVETNAEGWITSITDAGAHQMVRSTPERAFGSLLVSRGREDYKIEKLGAGQIEVSEGPIARRVRIRRDRALMPATEAVAYRGAPYMDLQFDVDVTGARDMSPAATRLALALPLPSSRQLYLDGAGFVMRVPQDILPGGRAPQFTPVQFLHQQTSDAWGVTLASRDAAVLQREDLFVLSNDSLRMTTRDEGTSQLYRTEPRSSAVLPFRFRLAAQPEDKAAWKRLAAEYHLPLRAQVLAPGAMPPPSRGFFAVDNPKIQMLAFKPAEGRPGWYIIRLQDNSGEGAQNVKLTSAFPVLEAQGANLVEQPEGGSPELSNLSLKPWQTITILVRLKP